MSHEKKPINIMRIQLKHAKEWENKLRPRLEKYLHIQQSPLLIFFSQVLPSENHSTDVIIKYRQVDVDFKVRAPKYYRSNPDIAVELKTGYKQGWFYTLESVIYYTWELYYMKDPQKNCLIDGFFIKVPELRKQYPSWIVKMTGLYYHERQYAVSEDEGNKWLTKNVYVPLREFPKNLILRYNLDPEPIKEQSKITHWNKAQG